jgi:outer membrane protein
MKRALVVLLLSSPGLLSGQEPQSIDTLTLAEAIRLATANSPVYGQVSNDQGAADWGVRSAYARFLPSFTLSGSLGYRGPGTQTFLTTTFRQSSATVTSTYSATLNWNLSGETITEPGLRRAQRDAAVADVASAEQQLESRITQGFVNVLQAEANAELQRVQVQRNEENLRLAEARYAVGQVTRLDPQQARVVKGQSEVELLRFEQLARVERLRVFQALGISPPPDVMAVHLVGDFEIRPIEFTLEELLQYAEERHPELVALRKREAAAAWGVRSASSQFLPRVNVSAGWSGFAQQFTNIDPVIAATVGDEVASADATIASCNQQNEVFARLTSPLPATDCSQFAFTDEDRVTLTQQIQDLNDVFPFQFTSQPFQVVMFVSLPIFNGFQRELQMSEARAAREDTELALRDRALGLQVEVTQRFHDLQRALRTIEIQEQNQEAARDQLTLGRERYRIGQGSFFELLEAQLTAQQAERDHVNAIYEYHRAAVLLESAVGRELR